jgi:hypothetical protein
VSPVGVPDQWRASVGGDALAHLLVVVGSRGSDLGEPSHASSQTSSSDGS